MNKLGLYGTSVLYMNYIFMWGCFFRFISRFCIGWAFFDSFISSFSIPWSTFFIITSCQWYCNKPKYRTFSCVIKRVVDPLCVSLNNERPQALQQQHMVRFNRSWRISTTPNTPKFFLSLPKSYRDLIWSYWVASRWKIKIWMRAKKVQFISERCVFKPETPTNLPFQ